MASLIPNFNYVPDEILREISLHLKEDDLFLFRLVNKRWSRIGREFIGEIHHLELGRIRDYIRNLYQGERKIPNKEDPLYLRSLTIFHPGIEEYFDLYHCLIRSIRRSHHPACSYFLAKVCSNNFDIGEFATLFDLLGDHWDPKIFLLLVRKYLSCYRQHWHISLFENLKKENYESLITGLPQLIVTSRGVKCITRAPLTEDLSSQGGNKTFLQEKKYRDIPYFEKKVLSLELRLIVDRL